MPSHTSPACSLHINCRLSAQSICISMQCTSHWQSSLVWGAPSSPTPHWRQVPSPAPAGPGVEGALLGRVQLERRKLQLHSCTPLRKGQPCYSSSLQRQGPAPAVRANCRLQLAPHHCACAPRPPVPADWDALYEPCACDAACGADQGHAHLAAGEGRHPRSRGSGGHGGTFQQAGLGKLGCCKACG